MKTRKCLCPYLFTLLLACTALFAWFVLTVEPAPPARNAIVLASINPVESASAPMNSVRNDYGWYYDGEPTRCCDRREH